MPTQNETAALSALQAKLEAYIKDLNRPEDIFQLSPHRSALVAVDMQNFVCQPEKGRELPGMNVVIRQTNKAVDFCHRHSIPVIWIQQNFSKTKGGDNSGLYPLFHKSPLPEGMFDLGKDTGIFPEMHLDAKLDHLVPKNRYSAFAPGSSRLKELLQELGRDQIVICGVATNVCVESTARDAMQHGFELTLLSDAATAFDPIVHQVSLMNIKLFFGDVRTVDQAIRELAQAQ